MPAIRLNLLLRGRRLWLFSAGFILCAVLGWSHAWGADHLLLGRPPNVGNSSETVAFLRGAGRSSPYRFAVIGDPEDGVEVFERCLEAAGERGCDFVVICGDVVHRASESAYRYFLAELAEVGYSGPVFTVLGNHDAPRGSDELFRRHFGPPNFHFVFRGDLFLLVDNSRGLAPETRCYLEETLEEMRSKVRRVFLFAHRPFVPYGRQGKTSEPPGEGTYREIEDLVERYRIEVLCTAHFHSYRKTLRDGSVHFITGGGGGRLQEGRAFHHYVEFDVREDGVDDSIVPVSGPDLLESADQLLERVLVRDLFFSLQDRPGYYLFLLAFPLAFLATRRLATGALPS